MVNPENAPPVAANRDEAQGEKGDMLCCLAHANQQEIALLDLTAAGVNSLGNKPHTIVEGEYTSGLANNAEQKKDIKHGHYLHDGNAYGVAMCGHGLSRWHLQIGRQDFQPLLRERNSEQPAQLKFRVNEDRPEE